MSSSSFPYTLTMMRLIGVWPPLNKIETLKDYFAIIRAAIMFFLAFTFTILQIVQIIIFMVESKEFLDNSFICCTASNVCMKMIMMSTRHKYVKDIVEYFNKNENITEDSDEIDIQQQINYSIKYIAQADLILVGSTITMLMFRSISIDLPERTLPFEIWSPLNLTNYSYYIVILIYQHTAHAASALIGLTFDIFFTCVMLQCCAQMRLLEHRFKNFHKNLSQLMNQYNSKNTKFSLQNYEDTLIKKYIMHHSEIYCVVKYSNAAFRQSIFVQYSMSSFIICASVYSISLMKPGSPEFMTILFYILCILLQLFIYCLCGNEVTDQSLRITVAVYSMNWNSLNIRNRKLMMMTMMRAQKELKISGGFIFILSLSSLTNILKLAYSIYNFFSNSN